LKRFALANILKISCTLKLAEKRCPQVVEKDEFHFSVCSTCPNVSVTVKILLGWTYRICDLEGRRTNIFGAEGDTKSNKLSPFSTLRGICHG